MLVSTHVCLIHPYHNAGFRAAPVIAKQKEDARARGEAPVSLVGRKQREYAEWVATGWMGGKCLWGGCLCARVLASSCWHSNIHL